MKSEKNEPLDMFWRILGIIEEAVLTFGVFLLLLVLVANVIAREFSQSAYFYDEVALLLVVFITFVGIGYASRKARHIRMAAIYDLMNERTQQIMIYAMAIVSAVTMFIMGYLSIKYILKVKEMEQVTGALQIPYWLFILITPFGYFAASAQYVRTIFKNIKTHSLWLSPEQKSEYEDNIVGE